MNTGVYTCPADGIYLVSMVIQAQLDGLINCWLHKNQIRTQLEVHLTGRAEESGSQIAVLLLNKGDTLYIGNCEETNIGDETTFTVVLLHTIS